MKQPVVIWQGRNYRLVRVTSDKLVAERRGRDTLGGTYWTDALTIKFGDKRRNTDVLEDLVWWLENERK